MQIKCIAPTGSLLYFVFMYPVPHNYITQMRVALAELCLLGNETQSTLKWGILATEATVYFDSEPKY